MIACALVGFGAVCIARCTPAGNGYPSGESTPSTGQAARLLDAIESARRELSAVNERLDRMERQLGALERVRTTGDDAHRAHDAGGPSEVGEADAAADGVVGAVRMGREERPALVRAWEAQIAAEARELDEKIGKWIRSFELNGQQAAELRALFAQCLHRERDLVRMVRRGSSYEEVWSRMRAYELDHVRRFHEIVAPRRVNPDYIRWFEMPGGAATAPRPAPEAGNRRGR